MLKYFYILISGTAIAQIVNVISSVILARLYLPADFGIYSYFVAMYTLMSGVAALKYEQAILIPVSKREALAVTGVSFLMISMITTLSFLFVVVVMVGPDWIALPKGIESAVSLLPLFIILVASNQLFSVWNIRNLNYKWQSRMRMFQAALNACLSILFYFYTQSFWGLVLGTLSSQFVIFFLHQFKKINLFYLIFKFVNFSAVINVLVRFKRFPKLMLPASFMEILASYLPVFVILPLFGESAAGYFFLANTVVRMPITFAANAISDVVRERLSKIIGKPDLLKDLFFKLFVWLTVLSAGGFVFIAIVAPTFFEVVYGRAWVVAGTYTQVLCVMYFFQFLVSPLSSLLILREKQGADLAIQTFVLVGLVGAILYCSLTASNIVFFLMLYVGVYSCKYLALLYISIRVVTDDSDNRLWRR